MIAVLLGIDLSSDSPRIAARITFRAEDRPAALKKCLASTAAVGWFITLPYMDSRV
jgi:hypothetical protein